MIQTSYIKLRKGEHLYCEDMENHVLKSFSFGQETYMFQLLEFPFFSLFLVSSLFDMFPDRKESFKKWPRPLCRPWGLSCIIR